MKIIKIFQIAALLIVLFQFSFFAAGQSSAVRPKLIIPFGHQLGIKQSVFSHDNKLLITADDKMTIISDVRSGKPLFYLTGNLPAVSGDDKYVATTADTLVMIWDMANGEMIKSLTVERGALRFEFNPGKNLLLVSKKAGQESLGDDIPYYCDVVIWDFLSDKVLHEFSSRKEDQKSARSGACEECNDRLCPIYESWFNNTGDSVRLIYKNLVKTYPLGNYDNATRVCLRRPGKEYPGGNIKVLNNRIIENYDNEGSFYFTEFGNLAASWKTANPSPLNPGCEFECISPSYNFEATYTTTRIVLRNFLDNTTRFYEVKGLKKLMFNQAGTHVLAMFLNEAPRMLSLPTLTDISGITLNDYRGLPDYVYETVTMPDAALLTSMFDSVDAKIDKITAPLKKIGKYVPVLNPGEQVSNQMGSMKNDINSSFTNSGEIVNLVNNRTISKIQSLIKFSGDIKLSPDKTIMLLNTGKIISLYSIPYAKILANFKSSYQSNVFSPDSRWMVQYSAAKTNLVNLATGHVQSFVIAPPHGGGAGERPTIVFSSDSRVAVIGYSGGGSALIDIRKGSVSTYPDLNYFFAEQGDKYGITSLTSPTVRVFSSKDSAQLLSIDLPVKNAKKNQQQNYNYKISFNASNAVAIWDGSKIVYLKDINKPGDTTMFSTQGVPVSHVTLSPKNTLMSIQLGIQSIVATTPTFNIVADPVNKTPAFPVMIGNFNNPRAAAMNMGPMMREIMGGNTDAIVSGRELAQFSQSGDSILVCKGDSAVIFSCATGARLKSFRESGEIKYFSFGNDLLISNYHGQLKFNSISDGREWFSMIPFTNGETVFLMPDGTYFGSKAASRHLGYVADAKSLSYKQFDFNNNRPDIVLRALGNTDTKYIAMYDSTVSIRRRLEGLRDTKTLNFDKAPEIVIANEKELKGEVKDKMLTLNLKISGGSKYPDRLALFINGNPVGSQKGIRLSHKSNNIDTTVKLMLTEGNNIIEASVFDMAGLESYRQPLYIFYSPDVSVPKSVYFAGIGAAKYGNSAKNLSYARADVINILDSLQSHYHSRFIVDTLFDNKVTVENLRKLKTKFAGSHPDDVVIVYYSGHGEIDKTRAEAFFGTYDMDFNAPSKRGISIKDFNDLMENIPARNKAVFLDACHSGAINSDAFKKPVAAIATQVKNGTAATKDDALDKLAADNTQKGNTAPVTAGPAENNADMSGLKAPGETDPFDVALDLFTDLYQGNGGNIIAAARGLEAAKECPQIKGGVFTYAVLNGMRRMAADEDTNAVLTIGELQNYVTRNVTIFSDICDPATVQRASTRKENEFNDWAIIDNGATAVRKKSLIKITQDDIALSTKVESVNKDIKDLDPRNMSRNPRDFASGDKKDIKGTFENLKKDFGSLIKKKPKDYKVVLDDYQKKTHPNAVSLFKDSSYSCNYEILYNCVIFDISCPGYIPTVQADVDGNGDTTKCKDRLYKKDLATASICTQFVTDRSLPGPCAILAQDCNGKASTAVLAVDKDRYLFMIPVDEISSDSKKANVNFVFYNDSSKQAVYVPVQSSGKMFEKTLSLKL